jgi:hypothetical protein
MTARRIATTAVAAAALASTLSSTTRVAAQSAPAYKPYTIPNSTYVVPKSSYVPPKTPWGDPDIQGVYDYQSLLNIERPKEFAGKRVLTDAEFAEAVKNGVIVRGNAKTADGCGVGTRKDEVCTEAEKNQVTAYNEFWNNRNFIKDNRTALIEDPPDGRFPPLTPEAEKRKKEIVSHYGGSAWASWEDTHPLTRCIASQTPNAPQMYNSGTYIMQSPGWVLIVRERLDTRVIPIDGREHVGSDLHQWNGHSIGRWEGNTLVVDTTNFTDKQWGGGGSGATVDEGIPFGKFHLVEHFVPVSATRIDYYATMEDPSTWTQPWTLMLPWEKDAGYQIYEYACHEGNISVGNALRGQRELEGEQRMRRAAGQPEPAPAGGGRGGRGTR